MPKRPLHPRRQNRQKPTPWNPTNHTPPDKPPPNLAWWKDTVRTSDKASLNHLCPSRRGTYTQLCTPCPRTNPHTMTMSAASSTHSTDSIDPETHSSHPSSPSSPASSHVEPVISRHALRSVLMRAGTSKGLFLHLEDLPADRAQWEQIILSCMGSPDVNLKQLDGAGGGVSTQSKVAVISRSSDPRADVDYLFIQGGSFARGCIDDSTNRWRTARLFWQLREHGKRCRSVRRRVSGYGDLN